MSTPSLQPRRWLFWLLTLPTHPIIGVLGMVVATGCLDNTLLPWYATLLSLLLIGGAALLLHRGRLLPVPPLNCLLGLGGTLTGLLFWLNLNYCGPAVVRTFPILAKHRPPHFDRISREGEVSVTMQIGPKQLEIDLTRADTARVHRATVCDVGVARGLLGVDVVTQFRLR